MVNSGDLCLLNNVFPGFHISGVCSDICSFNRILHWIWMLLSRFDRDVIDSAVNLTTFFTVSHSAVYNGVACSRAAHGRAAPSRADKRSVVQISRFVPLSVRVYNVALVNRAWWERRLFIPFFKLRNNLSLTECMLRWRHRTCLSPKSAKILRQLWKLWRLLDFAIKFSNRRIAKSWRDCHMSDPVGIPNVFSTVFFLEPCFPWQTTFYHL